MEAKAIARTVRIAPRKARLVADLVRGKEIGEALAILELTPKAASPIIAKVVNSAVANGVHNNGMSEANIYVKEIFVNEGKTLKRFRPRAQGRASAINKRTSHITVVVADKN